MRGEERRREEKRREESKAKAMREEKRGRDRRYFTTSLVRSGAYRYPRATPIPPIHSSPSIPEGIIVLGTVSSSETT